MTNIIELLKQTPIGETILTFFAAMLPVLELRFAIPFGVSLGLNPWLSLTVSVIGTMMPVPFIILFIRKIFAWLCPKSAFLQKLVTWLENRAVNKWEKVHRFEFFALMLFAAIPLPGTGAWTSALIAAMAGMSMRRAIPAIFCGVLVAGFLFAVLTVGITALF